MLDPIAIHLGPLAIRWYALCIVTGLILAVYLTMKEAPRKKIIPVDNLDYLPGFIRDQMYIEGSYRQPTFLYESLWNLLGFALILILRRKWKSLRRGHITAFYLIWYGFGRMVIEGMRTDSLMFIGLRVSQWLSVVLIGLGIFIILYQNRKKAPYYVTEEEN